MLTVRAWMEREGIGQEDLARRLERSFVSVNRWMTGKRQWPFDVVRQIKKMSRDELTDDSFNVEVRPPARRRRATKSAA